MAALAGRLGDGFNRPPTHGWRPCWGLPAPPARSAARNPDGLLDTAFAGLDRARVTAGSPERRRLEALGVQRLVLILQPPFDPRAIAAAGRLLAG